MISFIVFIILTVLIILDKKKKISFSHMWVSVVMTVSLCIMTGVYVAEVEIDIVSILLRDKDAADAGFFDSAQFMTAKLVGLILLFIPFAAEAIYMLFKIIKEPVKAASGEDKRIYSMRCAKNSSALGLISVIVGTALTITLISIFAPFYEQFFKFSFFIIHPWAVLWACFIWPFIGIPLACVFVFEASLAIAIAIPIGALAAVFGLCGAIMGLAATVRAAKYKAVKPFAAVVSGLIMFVPPFSIFSLLYIKAKAKKSLEIIKNADS